MKTCARCKLTMAGILLLGVLFLCLNSPLAYAGTETGTGKTYLVQSALLREKVLDTQVRSGQVFVPLRRVAETLGYLVDWQWDQRRITIVKKGSALEIDFSGKDPILKELFSGKTYCSETAPVLINYTAFAPIAFFTDVLPEEVRYREDEVVIAPRLLKSEIAYGILASRINTQAMYADIDQLAEVPRLTTTDAEYQAADFIANRFKTLGYQVAKEPFTVVESTDTENTASKITNDESADSNQDTMKTSYNVIAVKRADLSENTGDILLVTAHYDSEKNSPGANDNGSGVAVLLEMARLFAHVPSDTEIRFIAFGAEEAGLKGSEYYLASLPEDERSRIIGDINFDTLASLNASPMFISTLNGQVNLIAYLWNRVSENIYGQRLVIKYSGLSDYITFANAGIPAAMLCQIGVVNELHTPNDNLKNISKECLTKAASISAEAINQIISGETGPFGPLEALFENLRKMTF